MDRSVAQGVPTIWEALAPLAAVGQVYPEDIGLLLAAVPLGWPTLAPGGPLAAPSPTM
jgi:hypothetical protein